MHDTENFGFKKVGLNQKKGLVADVFSSVASKYDLMNDLMSFGIHRCWKEKFCSQIPNLNSTILDSAAGSGDIALKIRKKADKYGAINNKIIISDINEDMLALARGKAIDNNFLDRIDYIVADAENLPVENDAIDYYTISFGIRNVTNISKVLQEAFRVLKPGGKFLCLEFSSPSAKELRALYNFYSFNIIPKIGKFIANNEEAYNYLVESINLFPNQQEFKLLIEEAGFERVSYQNLSLGIAAIHTGYKL
jgi:demethylmenaquinone methyltransferase / 2-methoxy-6-polyprenyl-1,4-benzoquinol methylase